MAWKGPFFWNSLDAWSENFSDGYQFGDLLAGYLGITRNDKNSSLENQANQILGEARNEYLSDREHTEMREDTAYQRAVADMRAAGLNPYTVGASPASSSASSVGTNTVANKLQILGYILDLENLNSKNRKITNDAIGNVLGLLKQK